MPSRSVETQTIFPQDTLQMLHHQAPGHHYSQQQFVPYSQQPRISYTAITGGLSRGDGQDYYAASYAEQLYQQEAHPVQQHYASQKQHQRMQRRQIPAQPQSHAAGFTPGNKVLAERYKTKVCKNYIEMGLCPYESRCMFAHGDDELRTAEMNLHDGLVTEEAIRHFKRMESYNFSRNCNDGGVYASNQRKHRPPSYEVSSFEASPNAGTGERSSGWTPYHNGGNPHCQCADCLYHLEVAYSSAGNQQQIESGEEEAELMESGEDAEEDATTAAEETTTHHHEHHTTTSNKAQADVAGHEKILRPTMP